MKTKLILLVTSLFTLNLNCEIPAYTSLKDVMQRCKELPDQTYAQSCDHGYAKFKDQINVRDEDGMLPITFDAYHNEEHTEQIVSALIRHGADLEVTDKYERTALKAAISNANPEIVNNLIQSGANLERVDKYGETPLFGAVDEASDLTLIVENTKYESPERLQKARSAVENGYAVLNTLIQAGANLEATNKNGTTPLYRHITGKNPVMRAYHTLRAAGAKIDVQNEYGWTPIHSIALNEEPSIIAVKALIVDGADVNIQAKSGNTPLHLITKKNKPNIAILKELIAAGADVNARNKKDHFYSTPLDAIWYPVVITGASEEQKVAAGILMKHGAKITDFNFKCLVLGGNNCKLIDPWDSILK